MRAAFYFFLGRFQPYNRVKTPVIFQLSETECGIAALATIFSFYQLNIPLEELREKCGTSRDGSKAITLMQVARNYGFIAEAFKMDLDAVALLKEPVIAFWRFNHYVVIEGIGRNRVFINDPASGRFTVSLVDFDKSFTGVVLAIKPTPKTSKLKSKPLLPEIIHEWLSEFQAELCFLFVGLSIIVSSPLLSSAFQSIFIDQCLILNRKSWIPYIAGFTFAISLLLIISSSVQKWNQFKLYTKASLLKSARIIVHSLKLPLLFFSLRQKSEMISILYRTEYVVNLFSKNAVAFSVGIITATICFTCMIKIDFILSLISFLISALFAIIIYFIARIKLIYEQSNIHAMSKLYAASISNIRNIETIKACGFEEKTLKKWQMFFNKKLNIQDKINVINILLESLNKFYFVFTTLSILGLGGFRIAQGIMSVGNLMAYYAIHLFFGKTLSLVFNAFKEIQTAYASHIRIRDVMECKTDPRFINKPMIDLKPIKFEWVLSCEAVTFFYNKTVTPIIKNISAKIHAGEHIALVGGTGSGKSTLAKLMGGLYPPCVGQVTLNSRSLADLTTNELVSLIAYVSQEVSLFTGTLYDNLTLWKSSISLAVIEEAIQDACLSELINSRGLYGKVEEQGNNLSGGEKQRIEIARSLIQNTPILILDEATSALDIQTEARIIQNLRKRCKTIIFVAHRLSTIRHCNQIWVLKNGQIIECGNHNSLMQAKNIYYCLVNSDAHAKKEVLDELSIC